MHPHIYKYNRTPLYPSKKHQGKVVRHLTPYLLAFIVGKKKKKKHLEFTILTIVKYTTQWH